MKTNKNYFFAFIVFACLISFDLSAQVKEVPVTTSSKEALNFFTQGRDKIENLQTSQAAVLFDKAIEKDPSFALAYLYKAQTGGGYNVFVQNIDKAVSFSGKVSDGEKLVISYFKSMADGNGQKRKESVDQLVSTFPSDKRVLSLAGEYYYDTHDFQKALDNFNKAAGLDKNYAPVYNMIGYCQSELNNYKEAEAAFQTYVKLVPDNPNPYDSYAELLLKTGKYDESIAQYKKALEKDPTFLSSLEGIGNNYVFKGDFNSARKYYQDYYDKSSAASGKLEAEFMKAVSYIHEGKTDEAVKAFGEYRAVAEKENLSTNVINSYALQGFTVTEGGDPKAGKEYFDKAIAQLAKSNLPEGTKENLTTNSTFWTLYSLTANNELDQASAAAEKCKSKVESRKNPNEEMFLNSLLGKLELKKGNFDQALQYLSKADATSPLTWYNTALAYNKKGDSPDAVKLFDKVAKWNINSIDLAFVRKNAVQETLSAAKK